MLTPWHWLTAPRFYGLHHIPCHRPFLLVGNHTLMGVLDAPLLVIGLYEHRGVFVRGLGDHLHFRVPVWRQLLTRGGVVEGTRDNCRALMRAGESILVYPGGGREVFKRKGEKYRLIWKSRIGFVRLAIEHHYPIIPFAAVGAEECYDIVLDADDLRTTSIGRVLARLAPRPEEIPPLVRGIGVLPRPERFYFRFGQPIETAPFAGRQEDEAVCFAIRAQVQGAIEQAMRSLFAIRARDPHRDLPARFIAQLRNLGPMGGSSTRKSSPDPTRSRSKSRA